MQTMDTGAITDSIAKTLFIPLYMRHLESLRNDGMIYDKGATRIVDSVDYDFSQFDNQMRARVGVCIRVRHFDRLTARFIEANDNPVVVNLGCGLDTRSERIGSDKAVFYQIDLPEVMAIRDRLLPADELNISMHASMFDSSWARKIREEHPDAQILVISEGVLFYFTEEEVRPVIELIARDLAPGELLFDGLTTTGCKLSARMSKKINAPFKWGLDNDRDLEQWAPNIRFQDVAYYLKHEKSRWDPITRFMSMFPLVAKASKMLHYKMLPA